MIQIKNDQTTIYVIDVSNQFMKLLVAMTDMSVAFAYGSERELRRFIAQRRGLFDMLEAVGNVCINSIDELRKI